MTSQMDEDLFEMANFSPVHAAKECRQKIANLKRGYRAQLRHCVAEAYGVAYGMARDNDAWCAFVKEGFWKKRKKRPRANRQNKILLHVMVYVFDATSKNAYDRAWKYATALEKYFNEGVKPGKIEKIIEETGGLEALLRSAQEARKLAKKKALFADESYFDLGKSTSDAKTDAGFDQDEEQDGEPVKQEQPPDRKGKNLLRFSAPRSVREELLNLDEGAKARLTIQRRLGRSAARIIKVTPLAS